MGCGNSKTKDEEVGKNEKKENINNDNNEINNNEKEIRNEKKIKIIKKLEEGDESKINGEPTKTSIKEIENNKNYEDYEEDNEICEEIEEDEIIDEKEMKEMEIKERRKYLDNLRFQDIFKEDNINKHNTSIFDDRKQKVRTIFIPSHKLFGILDSSDRDRFFISFKKGIKCKMSCIGLTAAKFVNTGYRADFFQKVIECFRGFLNLSCHRIIKACCIEIVIL